MKTRGGTQFPRNLAGRKWALRNLAAPVAGAFVALASWAGAPVAAGLEDFDQYRVRKPGTVLVDRDARLGALSAMGTQAGRFCHLRSAAPLSVAGIAPMVSLEGRLGYGGNDQRVAPFDYSVIVLGAEAFGAGSSTAYERFMSLVTRWAHADAMTEIENDVAGSNTSVLFGLKRTLATLIPNWAVMRADPRTTDAERQLVDRWIGRLVNLTDTNTGSSANRATRVFNCAGNQESSNCNNHRYLRDEVNIMWGALSGDDARFRKGVERFTVALRQMRPDGSLPLETARGSRALWYQNYAVGMLVAIAEVAAQQGYDLYGMEIEGRSLHRAVAFLLEGVRRPQKVLRYAKANRAPGPGIDWREQDLRFTEPRGRWHAMAWLEAYASRFPDHPNTERIREELPGPFLDRPLAERTSGGMTSCFFARP